MPVRPDPTHLSEILSGGTPTYLGVITATTAKNNHTTAVPFNNTGDAMTGKVILVVPTADCYILQGTTNAATVTAANGVPLYAGERVPLALAANEGWLAVLPVGSTVDLKVWELR